MKQCILCHERVWFWQRKFKNLEEGIVHLECLIIDMCNKILKLKRYLEKDKSTGNSIAKAITTGLDFFMKEILDIEPDVQVDVDVRKLEQDDKLPDSERWM